MISADYFDIIIKNTKVESLDLIVWFIMIVVVMWIYKKIELNYQKKTEIKIVKRNKYKEQISKSLYYAYRYKSDTSIAEEFYSSVFNCFSLFDSNEIKEVERIINDPLIIEKDTIARISEILKEDLIYMSKQDQELKTFKFGAELVERLVKRLIDILTPAILTLITIYMAFVVILLLYISSKNYFNMISIVAAILFIISLPFFADIYHEKGSSKLKRRMKVIFLVGLLLILIPIIFQYKTILFLIVFAVYFVISILFSLNYDNQN